MLLNGLLDTVALFFPQAETISRIKRMDRKSQYLPPVIELHILPFFLCMKGSCRRDDKNLRFVPGAGFSCCLSESLAAAFARSLLEPLVGCGALKFHPNAPGEIERMWVAPRARGLGLGRRLLGELEHSAREAGVSVLHLETNSSLIEAIQKLLRAWLTCTC